VAETEWKKGRQEGKRQRIDT
jgi:hypothetical protein